MYVKCVIERCLGGDFVLSMVYLLAKGIYFIVICSILSIQYNFTSTKASELVKKCENQPCVCFSDFVA